VEWLGSDAFGQDLEPGRVGECYLGLLLPPPPAGEPEAGRVLVVGHGALLHPHVPQPADSLVYELLTGHPDRQPHELVFLADLTGELRAWPPATVAPLTTKLAAVAAAVVWCWQRADLLGLDLPLEPGEDARALSRPAMTLARAEVRARLGHQVAHARCRWWHPSSGHRADEPFL
jgi:hypothetical protein